MTGPVTRHEAIAAGISHPVQLGRVPKGWVLMRMTVEADESPTSSSSTPTLSPQASGPPASWPPNTNVTWSIWLHRDTGRAPGRRAEGPRVPDRRHCRTLGGDHDDGLGDGAHPEDRGGRHDRHPPLAVRTAPRPPPSARALEAVEAELGQEFWDLLPADEVHDAVVTAYEDLSWVPRRTYVPLLAATAARQDLQGRRRLPSRRPVNARRLVPGSRLRSWPSGSRT